MWRRAFGSVLFTMLMAAAAFGQAPGGYLDVYIARVKPEKRAEFDAINKKIAEANRRNKGDTWIAWDTAYGEANTVVFTSTRRNYDEVEKSTQAFVGALQQAFGQAGAEKLFQDFNNTLESSRTEIRRRRWDLSYNAPADTAAYYRTVGSARWLRTATIHVRLGHGPDFEAILQDMNTAAQKSNQPGMRWISQAADGGRGGVYYISRLMSSLGELDQAPPLKQILGEDGYQKFLKMEAETVTSAETVLYHVLPELSSPPAEVAKAAPDFWNPKPKPAAKPKPKTPEAGKMPEKP
jgi:hypothetical protein